MVEFRHLHPRMRGQAREMGEVEFRPAHGVHVVRILLSILGLILLGIVARLVLLPEGYGSEGLYRPGAVQEEAVRAVRVQENDSCRPCHPLIGKLHEQGEHKALLCENCHAVGGDHFLNDMVIGGMSSPCGEALDGSCMRCHRQMDVAVDPEIIKLIKGPDHLDKLRVRSDHDCDQCHHVHAPLKWVREARAMVGVSDGG